VWIWHSFVIFKTKSSTTRNWITSTLKTMKSSARNIDSQLFDEQAFETNPFQKSHSVAGMQKAGKRPRIMKPLYSVRLS
jgi:hypothetical protein